MIVKIATDPGRIVELSAADLEAIKQQAVGAESEYLLMLFDSLSRTLEEMRWSPHQRFTIEVGLIKACRLAQLKPLGEVLGRIKELEARLASGRVPAPPTVSAAHRVSERPAEYRAKPSAAPVQPVVRGEGESSEVWGSIMTALGTKKPGLASALRHSKILEMTEHQIVVGVQGNGFQTDLVEKSENRTLIEEIAAGILHKKVSIKIRVLPATSQTGAKTMQKKGRPDEQDPAVQEVLKVFTEGEVIEQDESP
jgi:DNA polymerase III gamma/tau subunit